jgi:hypothetical protein
MKTPILLIIFNRPLETKRVFAEIKKARPEKLYIAADGPRPDKDGEAKACQEATQITAEIDWPCVVKTDFPENNMGCLPRLSSAISWFFDNEEEGIIFESDCLPNQDFFTFCETLLEKYRDNEKIMHIGGNNFLFNKIKIADDYYFSRLPHIWGWATWRRAWQKYDQTMKDFPAFKDQKKINNIFKGYFARWGWQRIFSYMYEKKIETWDYQWTYAIFKNDGLCINPRVNLVSNIGFHSGAMHTRNKKSIFADVPAEPLEKIVKYPEKIEINEKADELILKQNFDMTLYHYFRFILGSIKKIVVKK